MNNDPFPLLPDALSAPPEAAVNQSRRRVERWFAETAPLIAWDVIDSPLGPLYVAATERGLCGLDFGHSLDAETFLNSLNPSARTERNIDVLAQITGQLKEYFAGKRLRFDLPVDLSDTSPFQRQVLQMALQIPAGTIWTYGQVAKAIERPNASRAVGTALGRNPVAIVVPCHRVVGSDGALCGYGAGSGIESKRWLLHLEGAL